MRRQVVCLILAVFLVFGSLGTAFAEAAGAQAEETRTPEPTEEEPAASGAEKSASPTPEPSAESSEEPSASPTPSAEATEKRVTVAVSRSGGRIERDGVAVHDDALTLNAGEKLSLKASPDAGYVFAGATFGGQAVAPVSMEGEAAILELYPVSDGELELLFARQHELRILVTGDAIVSYAHGDASGEALSGDALRLPEGTKIRFSVRVPRGGRLDGVDFNGRSVSVAPDGEGASFSVTASESGVLNIRSTQATEITAILNNCSLLVREGTEWRKARDGKGAISVSSGTRRNFAIQPDPSCSLKTLLVDGEPIAWAEGAGGLCTFSLITKPGAMAITAVCQIVRESVEGVDPKTGVRYKLPGTEASEETNITEDSWISVEPVTSGPVFAQAQEAARSYGELLCAYDLTLHNSEGRYEPTTPVAVSIPIPADYHGGRLKVLHESDGGVSEIPYRTEDIQGVPCVTIFTDSFSIYMLVDSPEQIAAPALTDSASSGGAGPFILWIAAGAAAALLLAALAHRKRRAAH